MIPTAARHFRVYMPDLPGFGDSDKPRHVLDLCELADALVAWMDAVGLEQTTLVGNSVGCQIIVNVAVCYPDRVTRAILQGPTMDPKARGAPPDLAAGRVDDQRLTVGVRDDDGCPDLCLRRLTDISICCEQDGQAHGRQEANDRRIHMHDAPLTVTE